VAIGERLEHLLELRGIVVAQGGLAEGGAAAHEREGGHASEHIEKT
jgi:hypothetical protein